MPHRGFSGEAWRAWQAPRVAARRSSATCSTTRLDLRWPSCALTRELESPMNPLAPLLASSSDTATGVGIPLALAAGLVSFLSPCVLPLVPGYLSTVIGVTPADLRGRLGVRRVLAPSLLFIASFSAIFILLGLSATAIGSTLDAPKQALAHAGGAPINVTGHGLPPRPF